MAAKVGWPLLWTVGWLEAKDWVRKLEELRVKKGMWLSSFLLLSVWGWQIRGESRIIR